MVAEWMEKVFEILRCSNENDLTIDLIYVNPTFFSYLRKYLAPMLPYTTSMPLPKKNTKFLILSGNVIVKPSKRVPLTKTMFFEKNGKDFMVFDLVSKSNSHFIYV